MKNNAWHRLSHCACSGSTIVIGIITGRSYTPPKSSATVYGSPEVSLKRAVNSLTPFLAQVSR